MPLTLTQKIALAHTDSVSASPGDYIQIRPRHVMTHDNTASVLSKFRSLGRRQIHDRAQPVIALDHDIQNQSPENLGSYARIESFARENELAFFPAGSGIGHQIMIERFRGTGLARRRERFAREHVRSCGLPRHTDRSNRCRGHLGHRHDLVARATHRPRSSDRQTRARHYG